MAAMRDTAWIFHAFPVLPIVAPRIIIIIIIIIIISSFTFRACCAFPSFGFFLAWERGAWCAAGLFSQLR
jgi:hypothetical protein